MAEARVEDVAGQGHTGLTLVDPRRRRRVSKLGSLLLRHDPGRAGLELDRAGWTTIDALAAGMRRLGVDVSREELLEVADPSEPVGRGPDDKPRFEVAGGAIRARYGHSVPVELGYQAVAPPDVLYHGTAADRVASIVRSGISPMGRRQMHLSADVATARRVGSRHGPPVVLVVDAASMAEAGATFHALPGGTWLTDEVPPAAVLGPVDEM